MSRIAKLSLTRAAVARIEKEIEQEVEDEKDYDMDDWMAMSDAEHDARLAETEREGIEAYQKRQRQLAQLPRLERYRYERRWALYHLLDWHTRHDRMKVAWPTGMDFIHDKNRAIIKRRQAELLDWRLYLRTGVLPSQGGRQ